MDCLCWHRVQEDQAPRWHLADPCIFLFSKKPITKVPTFKERKGSIALSGEWLNTKQAIENLLKAIELNPQDYKSKLNLSQAYIQEARITGDHAYYDQAALELLDDVIKNAIARKNKVSGYLIKKGFMDIGDKASYRKAYQHYIEKLGEI